MHGGAPDRARRRKKAAPGFLRSVFIRSSDGPLLRWESSSSRSAVRAAASVARSRALAPFTIALSIVRRRISSRRAAPHRTAPRTFRLPATRTTEGDRIRLRERGKTRVLRLPAVFSLRVASDSLFSLLFFADDSFRDCFPCLSPFPFSRCRRANAGKRSCFVATGVEKRRWKERNPLVSLAFKERRCVWRFKCGKFSLSDQRAGYFGHFRLVRSSGLYLRQRR